jgi:hypothetical protein
MKKKELEELGKEVLDFNTNIVKELQILLEQNYCQFCTDPNKKTFKEFKRNSKIIAKAYTEIIKRKELNIE